MAEAIGLEVQLAETFPLARPRPATLLGSGKVERSPARVREHGVGLRHHRSCREPNSATQPREGLGLEGARSHRANLGNLRRARPDREGRLQVELAHLTYQRGRWCAAGRILSASAAASAFSAGPGEAQIETDRRLIQERIDAIKKDLAGVIRTRGLHRASRQRIPLRWWPRSSATPTPASRRFSTALTGAAVLAIDQVFADLDPTMREITLPSGRRIVLSDTVGFISDLPTNLIAAFRATLEEVVAADLICTCAM